MKTASIKFRLVTGGITLVLLPLLLVGYFSISKSSLALTDLSKNQAAGVAADLARLTDITLREEIILAQSIAMDPEIDTLLTKIRKNGMEGTADQISALHQNLAKTFETLGAHHQGIYVTDFQGNRITGVLEGGQEYKKDSIADRSYFQAAKTSGNAVIGDVARSATNGKLICAICIPVKSAAKEFIGSFVLTFKVEFLSELISTRKIGNTGYGFMIDKTGLVLAHPVADNVLKLDISKVPGMGEITSKMTAGQKGVEEYVFKGVDKIAGFAPLTEVNWYVAATQETDEFLKAARSIRTLSLSIGLAAMVLTAIIVIYFAGLIVKPLTRAIDSLRDIAEGEGDLTKRLDDRSQDEVGVLGLWFNKFIEKLQAMIKRIAENSDRVNGSANQLLEIARQMSAGADDTSARAANLATASEEMTANLNNVAAAMEQSSTNTNMVASAAEEMSATINEIADNAERAREISSKAVVQAKNASVRMEELGKAAQKISMVTETITEISEQTNLLALNATIEAARAGEAGKGFAVVANEIKDLAKQTAQATLNIKGQIDDVQRTTQSTVIEINEISEVIGGVNDIVATIATAVEEQTAATREIASNISQASQGIQEVNENVNQSSTVSAGIAKDISQVNLAATGISQSSREVRTSSEDLQRMAKELNTIVGSFKV
jgi:methyl-accepting chemotaxis protein